MEVSMSSTGAGSDMSMEIPGVGTIDMKLEVVTLPVSDVDRAKRFYQSLGWRLDADIAAGDAFRVVQLTPPRSQCSMADRAPMNAPGHDPVIDLRHGQGFRVLTDSRFGQQHAGRLL
jgi:catechol 2,3-dioxygenase-like lactoylglutathione lyase family enzyme